MILTVDSAARRLRSPFGDVACAIGEAGTIAGELKAEGDHRTPIGRWPIRGALLRPDRITLTAAPRLPWRWLRQSDGWSDDSRDPSYNRPVRLLHGFSAEQLWRDDGAYDVIVVLGHNSDPPQPGRGSAIFFHCATPAGFTEGCVAIERASLIDLLTVLSPGDAIEIR